MIERSKIILHVSMSESFITSFHVTMHSTGMVRPTANKIMDQNVCTQIFNNDTHTTLILHNRMSIFNDLQNVFKSDDR